MKKIKQHTFSPFEFETPPHQCIGRWKLIIMGESRRFRVNGNSEIHWKSKRNRKKCLWKDEIVFIGICNWKGYNVFSFKIEIQCNNY